mmetsp:Transcript_24713/g.51705  ORF Transcript_24713/g.51705 Transcript_24713/m.51705 type:complete len:221 (-) Transcript_24713:1339-2001(-)
MTYIIRVIRIIIHPIIQLFLRSTIVIILVGIATITTRAPRNAQSVINPIKSTTLLQTPKYIRLERTLLPVILTRISFVIRIKRNDGRPPHTRHGIQPFKLTTFLISKKEIGLPHTRIPIILTHPIGIIGIPLPTPSRRRRRSRHGRLHAPLHIHFEVRLATSLCRREQVLPPHFRWKIPISGTRPSIELWIVDLTIHVQLNGTHCGLHRRRIRGIFHGTT